MHIEYRSFQGASVSWHFIRITSLGEREKQLCFFTFSQLSLEKCAIEESIGKRYPNRDHAELGSILDWFKGDHSIKVHILVSQRRKRNCILCSCPQMSGLL